MASRRRRRKGIGKVLTSVERKVRRIEKRPGAKRLKRNVVTTEKILPRAIVTKKIATDAVTANEAEFGVTVVTDTEPTEYLKEGTTWVNPDDGAAAVYSTDSSSFIPITDAEAQSIAASKNTTYVQNDAPTGGTYTIGDLWIDINDGNKLYAWNGTSWEARQDGAIATAQTTADGKNTIYRQTTTPTGGTYVSGDIWFDVDDNNRIYRYSATTSTSTVTNKALTNNVATLTTSAAHFFTPGETITVSGVDATFNGSYTVTAVPTSTTLTYAKTATNVTSAASGGSIVNTAGWKAAVLGGNALANVNANSITAGTIDASVITVSNINAGNISTGILDASIITVRNAIGSDRIELNNLGLFAYQSNIATVSITNTGTAVFSGTVNAAGGNFTGFVTGGTMRFGANVNGTNDGVYINANNYWYDTGDFQVGSGTAAVSFNSSTGALSIGSTASISGTTASTIVSNASEGATALQPGNGVVDDPVTDQIVSISTANGIRIGTSPGATGNTARVEINSGGFFAYNGSVATVQITSAGNATFTGTITGSTFTSTNYGVAGGTGIAIATAGDGGSILFNSSGTQKGNITVVSTGMNIVGGSSAITMTDVTMLLNSPGIDLQIDNNARLSSTGGFTTGNAGILRNTWASSSAPSPTSDPGAPGSDGDVWLRWS